MNYNPAPKSEFLKNQTYVKNHHALIENPVLAYNLQVALSEMHRRAAAGTDPQNFNMCAASHLRLMGAQELAEIFLNLAETTEPARRDDNLNLPGNVAQMPRKN